MSLTPNKRPGNLRELTPTIVIATDPQAEYRGYSLAGREFVLKEPNPRFDECLHTDGVVLKENFYVIDRGEYLRVVPEASRAEHPNSEVYIPVYVARRSFRPRYLSPKSGPRISL